MKKLFISISSIAAVVAPISIVVACGDKNQIKTISEGVNTPQKLVDDMFALKDNPNFYIYEDQKLITLNEMLSTFYKNKDELIKKIQIDSYIKVIPLSLAEGFTISQAIENWYANELIKLTELIKDIQALNQSITFLFKIDDKNILSFN